MSQLFHLFVERIFIHVQKMFDGFDISWYIMNQKSVLMIHQPEMLALFYTIPHLYSELTIKGVRSLVSVAW